MQDKFYLGNMLVVQYLAPTAITRYWCYRYRILPVTLY